MFNPEFYPTPANIIDLMLNGQNLNGKTVLEPSAGKGDIIDALNAQGCNVLACEINRDLAKIAATKAQFLKQDFFDVTSEDISHIHFIVMNPPFSNAHKHILHAWNIAPSGCVIISLCNAETVKNAYSQERKEARTIIENFGTWSDIGAAFEKAERQTSANIGLVKMVKPGADYSTEFEGFFMEEEEEAQENGIMSYNFVRDVVNRYIGAIKIFDEQLTAAVKMNSLTASFYSSSIAMSLREGERDKTREAYKKDLQKNAWSFILDKMNLKKYATRGLREDINKFVEEQQKIPFTMRNIYHMVDIVIGTSSQRIDKAVLEVFDKITGHHAENRHNVKGWKTNSHFLVGKKFILPYMVPLAKEYGVTSSTYYYLKNSEFVDDLEKALCFITGENYDNLDSIPESKEAPEGKKMTISQAIRHAYDRKCFYGEYYESHFFKFKGFKNGNMHFEFMSEDVWGIFNQRIAKIKGFPLFEYKKQTAYQERQTGRTESRNNYDKPQAPAQEAKVLFTFKKTI